MQDFLVLITELLLIVILQTIIESILDADKHKGHIKVVNVACIIASYVLLLRYIFTNLWSELLSLILF